MKRVFIIVADSLGVGELPDAKKYGDEGSNTLRSTKSSKFYRAPTLEGLGLSFASAISSGSEVWHANSCVGKMAEKSVG